MNDLHQDLLELAFAAGGDPESFGYDLSRLIGSSVPVFMQKLDCSGALAFHDTDQGLQLVYSSLESVVSGASLTDLADAQFRKFSEQKGTGKFIVVNANETFYHIFYLKNFGILVLFRKTPLQDEVMEQLLPVVDLLSQSCRSAAEYLRHCETEETLKQERNLLRTIIDNIPDPIYVKDLEGRKILLNKAEADLLNATVEAVTGKTDAEFYPPAIAEKTRVEDLEILKNNVSRIHEEGSITLNSGEVVWLEGNKIPYCDEKGNVAGIIGISHNISERKESEEKLAKLLHLQNLLTQLATEFINIPIERSDGAVNRLLQLIGESNQIDRVYIFNYDDTTSTMSNTHEWCTAGITPEIDNLQSIPYSLIPDWVETHKKGEMMIVPDVKTLNPERPLRNILESQCIRTLITIPMILNKECLGFVGFDSVNKVKDWSREEITFLQLLADLLCNVSERKRTEQALKTREAYLKAIFNNVPYQMWLKDMEGRYLLVNQPFLDYFSFTDHDSPIGRTAKDLWPPEISQSLTDQDNEVMRKQELKIVEELLDFHGKKVWFEIYRAPILDPNGVLLGTTGIARDVTRRIIADQQLQQATQDAESSNIAKTRFLANMSHEIRTPLNAIIGMLRLLRDSECSDRQMKLIDNMKLSSENLLSIINNILDFSKIESGQIELEKTGFSLPQLIRRVYDANEFRAEEKGIKLRYTVDERIREFLTGDPVRLQQILTNLVSNAIKFTREGIVELRCELKGSDQKHEEILFLVEDTGIGISPENQKKIFQSFQQEDESITRTYGGTGLGLAISKQLVELMKGVLGLESTKNRGSKFYFTIHMEKDFSAKQDNETRPVFTERPSLQGLRILLVEDNKFNQFIAQAILEKWGAIAVLAETGKQALEKLRSDSFDLILMDIQMPEMDGITAATIIRQELKLQTPILALTANVVLGIVERCEQAGMQGYISKPFDEEELFSKIKSVVVMPEELKESEPDDEESIDLCDVSRLQKMMGNDPVMLNKMIAKFLEVTPEYISELADASNKHDVDAISRTSHKIKSATNLVSNDTMRSLIETINDMGKTGVDSDELHEMIRKFIRYFGILCTQLGKLSKPV